MDTLRIAPTGVPGFDDLLGGGLPRDRLYLTVGTPGVGKTTFGLQFLLEGRRRDERALYVTLSETSEELRDVAVSHGWTLDKIELLELSALDQSLANEGQNTLFHPAEIELNETIQKILKVIEQLRPSRVVIDSLSEIRLLAGDALRYRRQILSLKQYFIGKACTVLLLDDGTARRTIFSCRAWCTGCSTSSSWRPSTGPSAAAFAFRSCAA